VLSGVLVVDKPAGPTSHDVVDRIRRVLQSIFHMVVPAYHVLR